jgi:hypothetical protein
VASFEPLYNGNVRKALVQKREEALAPGWHGKIHRTDHGKRKQNEEVLGIEEGEE